jgi:protein SCO1/2
MSRNDSNAGKRQPAPKPGPATTGTKAARRSRWPLPRVALLLGAVLLALGLGLSLLQQMRQSPGQTASTGVAAVGGPFRLIDQNGRAANQDLLKGKWSAVFFGYTYCPDICPATLTSLKVAKTRLGPKADPLQVVFVTIDPERDTPAQLKSYLSSPAFPQPIVGLTGTPEQIAAIAKAYKVFYRKNGTGSDYLMDHGSAIYLMDPKGQFHSLVSTGQGIDSMTFDIGHAMGIL